MIPHGGVECPLCHSKLSQARYLQVVGVWRERERFKASLKEKLAEAAKAKQEAKGLKVRLGLQFQRQLESIRKQLAAAADRRVAKLGRTMEARLAAADRREARAAGDRKKLLASLERMRGEARKAEMRGERRAARSSRALIKQLERRIAQSEAASRRAEKGKSALQRDFKRQILQVRRAASDQGKAEIKKANEKVLRTVHAKDSQIQILNSQVKELHEQIRRGVTQQLDGLAFEKTLAQELGQRFNGDLIQAFGKAGDILHTVRVNGAAAGMILYECKKTDKWSNGFLQQVKRDMATRRANYGVVVTFALPKSARGFLVRSGVSFVHPYGALHLADVLRTSLLELHDGKMAPGKMDKRLKALMAYIQGNRFKGAVRQIIGETHELVQAMKNEMQAHKRFWRDRYSRYGSIYQAASRVKAETVQVLKGNQDESLESTAIAGFLPMPTPFVQG